MIIKENFSLKEYNTFHIDVSAKHFVELNSDQEATNYFKQIFTNEEKYLILGGGSNVLFVNDFEGTIIHPTMKGITIQEQSENEILIEAAAGEEWEDLVNYCVQNKYYGIENLAIIPGLVGAAPIQNIGAYGVELVDVFDSLDAIDMQSGKLETFSKEQCQFDYRDSIFKREWKGKYLITKVRLRLSKNEKLNTSYKALSKYIKENNISNTIENVANVITTIRRSKLPDPDFLGNAGSFFKNPVIDNERFGEIKKEYENIPSFKIDEEHVKLPAAWLIEKSGLKGYRLGDVGTHINQPLVIVNYGNAKGSEIIEFMKYIQSEVKKKFKISLVNEVNIIQ
jgi:UDP-N-acetylmuramate dehydrogenase